MEDFEGRSREEGMRLEADAQQLENAVYALFDVAGNREEQQHANQWLSQFVGTARAWTVSLYLAFPPRNSGVGKFQEVRFFALNLLLSKIRNDWVQLTKADAQEMYETLVSQLPLMAKDGAFASRLSVVVCAAAAVVGEVACYEIVESVVGSADAAPAVEGPVAIDLLLALAEEALLRSHSLRQEVGMCLEDCCPQILKHLEIMVHAPESVNTLQKAFVCLERWITAGITLSEVFSDYPVLSQSLLDALGSPSEACFDAAVAALVELISAVDLLPGRKEAIHAIMTALVAQKGAYLANVSSATMIESPSRKRAMGLCALVATVCQAEAPLVAKGEHDGATELLTWLVDASGGGGGLGIDGATVAVAAWPRLAAVPPARRGAVLQLPLFASAAKAVLQVAMYPSGFQSWQGSDVDEDNFYRFRESFAEEALVAFYKEMGVSFVEFITQHFRQATTWQAAEVCLYVITRLNKVLVADSYQEVGLKSSVTSVLYQLPGAAAVIGKARENWPHGRLVETAVAVLELYAGIAALDPNLLAGAVQYCVGALYITDARGRACKALRQLCHAAAPHIAAAQALAPLIAECEAAGSSVGLELGERLALLQGLAVVAASLPPAQIGAAFSRLTASATASLRTLSVTQERAETIGKTLGSELRVFTAILDCGAPDSALQPILPILQDVWPVIDLLAMNWAADPEVATSLCELWGMLAKKLGKVLAGSIPDIIARVTALFKQHLLPVCLECLSEVVLMSSKEMAVDKLSIDGSLNSVLVELSTAIGGFERILEGEETDKSSRSSSRLVGEHREKETLQQNAAEVLGTVCLLGRSFLHGKPALLLPSPAFIQIFRCAIGCIRRKELGSALTAAKFLADVVLCLSFSEEEVKDVIMWRLPEELVPHVDQAVNRHGATLVDVVLRTLIHGPVLPHLREALGLVLYALCSRYGDATKAAMLATVMSPNFPVRRGLVMEVDKTTFVAAAVHQPLHPRRRFQELIADFCSVFQGLMPAEALRSYADCKNITLT